MDWLACLDAMEGLFRWKHEHLPSYPDLRLEWGLYHHLRGGLTLEGAGDDATRDRGRALLNEGHETLAHLKREGSSFDEFHAWETWASEHYPSSSESPPPLGSNELQAFFGETMGADHPLLFDSLIGTAGPLADLPEALRRAALCPAFGRLFAAMAEFQTRRSEKDAALRLYALAVLVGRQIARYWLYRAQWETICGDPEQVDGYLTEGLNHCPDDIDLLRQMAEEKDRQGDMAAAITLLERAVDLKPNWPDLRYDLARLYERNEKTEESLDQFGKALEINPNYEDAALSHAKALMKRGQMEEAEEQLLDIQRREIKSQRVYQMLSQIYAERGDRRQAEHFSVLGAESEGDGS